MTKIKLPERRLRNGIITEYNVNLIQVDATYTASTTIMVANGDDESVVEHEFDGLIPFTYYEVTVIAKTSVGDGQPCIHNVRTTENGNYKCHNKVISFSNIK